MKSAMMVVAKQQYRRASIVQAYYMDILIIEYISFAPTTFTLTVSQFSRCVVTLSLSSSSLSKDIPFE